MSINFKVTNNPKLQRNHYNPHVTLTTGAGTMTCFGQSFSAGIFELVALHGAFKVALNAKASANGLLFFLALS